MRFKLSLDDATAIVDRIQATVRARWYAVLRENGTSEADCDRVSRALDYPGFELDPKVALMTTLQQVRVNRGRTPRTDSNKQGRQHVVAGSHR